jgi:hypothetical protein
VGQIHAADWVRFALPVTETGNAIERANSGRTVITLAVEDWMWSTD